jgi:hypothetical protein
MTTEITKNEGEVGIEKNPLEEIKKKAKDKRELISLIKDSFKERAQSKRGGGVVAAQ